MSTEPTTTLTLERASQIAGVLAEALAGAGAAVATDGWTLRGVAPRFLMGRHVPVATFEREGSTLAFMLAPTNPDERAYKRSARFDISYFSEDVADDAQQGIYDRHRAMIDRFATWMIAWDARGEPLP